MARWSRSIICFLCCYVVAVSTVLAETSISNILILKSNNNRFFNTSIEQLINQTRPQVKFNIANIKTLGEDPLLFDKVGLIITLGIKAAEYLTDNSVDIPVIHAYITGFQHRQHKKHPLHYALLLDQPVHRYIDFIDALLGPRKIAILSTESSLISAEIMTRLNGQSAGRIQQQLYAKKDNLINAVRGLLEVNDVLLSLPDPQIYNQQSLKGVLLTSYRQRKPVISYSPAHVKSGALAAIYTSPQQIGNQIAGLVNQLLTDPQFKPESSYHAADFAISINQRVADSLELEIPDFEVLQQQIKQGQSL